jgi:(5-formylfuran-3-yl)methyl phosphate synthase
LSPSTENTPRSAGLLVSVRSADEARAAVEGGASVVDVKEPDRGPLGRASVETWRAVRAVVPESIPVSVALGELSMWDDRQGCTADSLEGIAYRKLGLARAGHDWRADWTRVRSVEPGLARWVAVAYADWQSAEAPHPIEVLEASLLATDCSGLLVDTWDKSKASPLEVTTFWVNWIQRARQSGRFVALAGGLDLAAIGRLTPLQPDLFAVRGASCDHSDRRKTVSRERVAELVKAIQVSGRSVV